MQQKSSKKRVVIFIIAAALAVAALFCVFALYSAERNEREALNAELQKSSMELYIRNLAVSEREEQKQNAEKLHNDETAQRAELTAAMLERDRQELLALVNPWNEVAEDFQPRVVEIGDSKQIDERAYSALKNMVADCKAAGCRAVPLSAFRTREYQQGLYENKIQRLIFDGSSPDSAPYEAAREVAPPGTSEHELGLAVDIVDNDNPELDLTQEWTPTSRWLAQHCIEYGFILRYPDGTTDTTGIVYEPWHYRFIGREAAKAYIESGCATFEDFLNSIKG